MPWHGRMGPSYLGVKCRAGFMHTPTACREQAQAVSEFAAMAERTWGKGGGHSSAATVGLLQLLLQVCAARMLPCAHCAAAPASWRQVWE